MQGDLNCVDDVCYGGDLVRVKSSVGIWHVGSSGSGTFVESDADVLTADVYDIAWAPGGERFVSGSADGKLVIWNAGFVSETRTMPAAVTSVDWSCTGGSDVGNGYTLTCSLEKDKQYIACGLADGSVHILDADDLSPRSPRAEDFDDLKCCDDSDRDIDCQRKADPRRFRATTARWCRDTKGQSRRSGARRRDPIKCSRV